MTSETLPLLELPSFQQIAHCLSELGCVVNAAEAHGLLAGLLCGNKQYTIQEWLDVLEDETPLDLSKCSRKEQLTLEKLYIITEQLMSESEFEFLLLLPAANESLTTRASALGAWCQGFVTGLGLSGCYINVESKQESAEALQDMIEIAKINMTLSGSEEEEAAFIEVVNYVQIAVILIYRSLQFVTPETREYTEKMH